MNFVFLDEVYNTTCKPERKEGIDPEKECIVIVGVEGWRSAEDPEIKA